MRHLALLLSLVASLLASPVLAHKASDAYLTLSPGASGTRAALHLDLALRDLDATPLELDRNGDGAITWGEVRDAQAAIAALIDRNVGWTGCELALRTFGLSQRPDGIYASMQFDVNCPNAATLRPSMMRYTLLAEEDATHRAIVRNDLVPDEPALLLLNPRRTAPASVTAVAAAAATTDDAGLASTPVPHDTDPSHGFVAEGITHILGGLDHVLFLVCLLLPAVGRRDPTAPTGWRAHDRAWDALWPVLGLVTMFTLAHSVTLALASLGWIRLSPNIVEPLIAATIVATAVDNVRPFLRLPRAAITFIFGLVHGFGFAGALAEMGGLPTASFAWALLQFNLGIELGQLGIVAAALALLTSIRHFRARENWYTRWALQGGSAAVGGLGVWWLLDRLRWVAELAV